MTEARPKLEIVDAAISWDAATGTFSAVTGGFVVVRVLMTAVLDYTIITKNWDIRFWPYSESWKPRSPSLSVLQTAPRDRCSGLCEAWTTAAEDEREQSLGPQRRAISGRLPCFCCKTPTASHTGESARSRIA